MWTGGPPIKKLPRSETYCPKRASSVEFVKLAEAVGERQPAASITESTSQEKIEQSGQHQKEFVEKRQMRSQVGQCSNCGKGGAKKVCASCNASCYCDAECQHRHWKAHKVICNTIKELSDREAEKCTFKNPDQGRRCVELVGRKCTVECRIQDLKVKALWDTGAEVSLISEQWLNENCAGVEIKSVASLLGVDLEVEGVGSYACLLYTSPSPRDLSTSRMPSSA